MPATTTIFSTADALGEALAADVLAVLRDEGLGDRRVLLGCPGGRSLVPTYRALGALAARENVDLSRLVVVMMDEYLVIQGGSLKSADAGAHYSCRRFGHDTIRALFNAGLPPARKVPEENVWLPDVGDPPEYDRRIAAAGGIALFLLACGASDGHVAFNPPGSPRDSRTRIVPLAETTRRDNLRTFPAFRTLDEVPAHGVSVGVATIADLSRRAVLVLTGAEKREAARRVLAASGYEPDWPATIIHECSSPGIFLDAAAAGSAS